MKMYTNCKIDLPVVGWPLKSAGLALLGWVQGIDDELLPEDVLTLNLKSDISPDEEQAAVYMLATGLKFIWESRVAKKTISPYIVRAELEAEISLLRRSRLVNTCTIIQQMLGNM